MNLRASPGVAIREYPVKGGHVDYLLYADGKAIGTVEAKPVGHPLIGVETQSWEYVNAVPPEIPAYGAPLPFHYESTGEQSQFSSLLDPEPRSRQVFTFHRPEELRRLAQLGQNQVRYGLQHLPLLRTDQLWRVQTEAVTNLEESLAANHPRSLIQMATGSGKTFTAVSFLYRFIKYAGAKRVLFLVDRNNLGRQAYREFQQYVSPYSGLKFTDEFNVQHLHSHNIDPVSRVCITTIQRLYAMLQGQADLDEESEETSWFETDSPLTREPMPVTYNPTIPIEAFDFILTDECHRSIYNLWRQVLEYFDAFTIGLTATPTKQTLGFFHNNVVMQYNHERAVEDNVNVDFDVYTIRTKITAQGAKLESEPEFLVPRRDRRTRAVRYAELDDDLTYGANQLDRDVVALDQIRLVAKTFRESLPEIFPGRTEVPKTLVFAKDDSHAEDITRILREEFGKGNDFCQKITYRTTGKKPQDLLAEFRNSYNPRIAVTVDMIATGTDVKPLECLLFMRNVNSPGYFEQMKGRGVRVIDSDTLQTVTPDARVKDRFVIVDAVGVCDAVRSTSQPLDRQPSVSLEKLLDLAKMGVANADLASTLGARIARLSREAHPEHQDEIRGITEGLDLQDLSRSLLKSVDPDVQAAIVRQEEGLPEDVEPTEAQLDAVEQRLIADALEPFHNPKLRQRIVDIRQSLEQVIDEVNIDELLQKGYNQAALEKAQTLVTDFRQFIQDHREELEAIRLLYSHPYREGLRFRQIKELAEAVKRPPVQAEPEQVWHAFEVVETGKVQGRGGKQLADLVALVRHALDPGMPLVPVVETVQWRYEQWLEQRAQAGVTFTAEQFRWLEAIRDHIANSIRLEQEDFEEIPFKQLGGLGRAYEVFGDSLTGIVQEVNEWLAA